MTELDRAQEDIQSIRFFTSGTTVIVLPARMTEVVNQVGGNWNLTMMVVEEVLENKLKVIGTPVTAPEPAIMH